MTVGQKLVDMNNAFLVHDCWNNSYLQYPDKTALCFKGIKWTYNQLDELSDKLACQFLELGLQKHQRVAIYLDNSVETILSMIATLKAGGIFVIINRDIHGDKLLYILKDAGVSIFISHSKKLIDYENLVLFRSFKTILIDQHERDISNPNKYYWTDLLQISIPRDTLKGWLQKKSPRRIDLDVAALIYTSGSTGEPKGVVSTHRNIISAARSIISYLKNQPEDVLLNALPLSFDYGLYQVIMTFLFGGTLILEKSFTFIPKVLKQIESERVTGLPIVPTMLALIIKMVHLEKYDLSSLRYVSNTGAALPVDLIKRLQEMLPHVQIYSMFGLTECKRIAYLQPEEIKKRPLSVGKAMPNCEVFLLDEKGNEVSEGEIGELVVRGSNVMQGYWNAPDLTNNIFKPALGFKEKLLFTGDYFRKDEEGFLYFVGRRDDMIKCRGERTSAREIETVIYKLPQVRACLVAGIPDSIEGHTIGALVEIEDDKTLNKCELIKHCKKHLEPWFVPKNVLFVKEIPKNSNGKFDRSTLVRWLEQEKQEKHVKDLHKTTC
jgi:amino acid adenylation domain-containing protein